MSENDIEVIPVEMGVTGLKHAGGWVRDEFLTKLTGPRGMKIYREMKDNSAAAGAAGHAMDILARGAPWHFATPNDKPEATRWAEFAEECLHDMDRTWSEYVSDFLTCVYFGFSLAEMVFKFRLGESDDPFMASNHNDGLIGWRGFPPRGQESIERWDIGRHGYIHGVEQMDPNTGARFNIPIDKMLHFRIRADKNNPEGKSLFRNAYESYYYAKRIRAIEAIGIERDLAGMPVATIPVDYFGSNASTEQAAVRDQFTKMVQLMRMNENQGVVMPAETDKQGNPTGFTLKLLNSGGRRPIDVNEIIKRYEMREAMVVLADFVFLGQQATGSYALSSDKTTLFAATVGAILGVVQDEFNRKAIPKLMRLNGVPRDLWPELRHGDVEREDLTKIINSVTVLADRGFITPSTEDEDWLRERVGMPERDATASAILNDLLNTGTEEARGDGLYVGPRGGAIQGPATSGPV